MPRRVQLALLAVALTQLCAFAPEGRAQDDKVRSELPRGDSELFPSYRVVAFAGAPNAPGLGALGVGSLEQASARLRSVAAKYRTGGRKELPAMELITTVAHSSPSGGKYRTRQSPKTIRRYLEAARKIKALLLLGIQPGRSDFLTETKAYEEFLKEPDVGVALDPEWNMGPRGVPGRGVGSVRAKTVNDVSAYMSRIVEDEDLPQKLLMVHQFTKGMIRDRPELEKRDNVAVTLSADGIGDAGGKRRTYEALAATTPGFFNGFKLFYVEDAGLMSPGQVLDMKPVPDLVVYE
jgi:hypothetical protein